MDGKLAFTPISSDVPSYFIPMLSDIDRNVCFERAIKAALNEFTETHGRGPRVLDLGLAAVCSLAWL